MNKYKLINKTTGEEHLCEKVVIDGWDYYVSDEHPSTFKSIDYIICRGALRRGGSFCDFCKKIIATNNPIIDIPKVVDEVDVLGKTMVNSYLEKIKDLTKRFFWKAGFKCGYNKSQETHPFSEEDMKSFGKFCSEYEYRIFGRKTQEELLQLWKEQNPKTLYYE